MPLRERMDTTLNLVPQNKIKKLDWKTGVPQYM